MRKVCFLLSLSFTLFASHSQNKRNLDTLPQSTFENLQVVPDGVKESHQLTPQERTLDSLIAYFVSEGNKFTFTFIDKAGQLKNTHRDSLIYQYRQFLDTFISNYNYIFPVDAVNLKLPWFKLIYDKITAIAKTDFKMRSKRDIDDIIFRIDNLPETPQKIWLYLATADISVRSNTYYPDLEYWYNKAKVIADRLANLFDKALAYRSLGLFSVRHGVYITAIQCYYESREYMENCSQTRQMKDYYQGRLCDDLGNLFMAYDFYPSIGKILTYRKEASAYYTKSGSNYFSSRSTFSYYTFDAYLLANFDTDSSTAAKSAALKYMKTWHSEYNTRMYGTDENQGSIHASAAFYTIGKILESEGKYKTALVYFLQSLPYILLANDEVDAFVSCIENIKILYTRLKRYDLALAYVELGITFAKKTNNNYQLYNFYLDNASILKEMQRQDLSLNIVNQIQFDNDLPSILYPELYASLIDRLLSIKSDVFYSLGNKTDSVCTYENAYKDAYSNHWSNFSFLVQTESNSINGWLERSKNRVIDAEKRNTYLIETHARDRASQDSIINQQSKRETKRAVEDKEKTDRLNAELKKTNTELTNTKIELEGTIKKKDILLAALRLVVLGLVGAIAIIIYFFRRTVKQSRVIEKNAIDKEIQTHDVQALIFNLPSLMKRLIGHLIPQYRSVSNVIDHTDAVSKYIQAILLNSNGQPNSLAHEIAMSQIYASIFKTNSYPDNYIVNVNSKIEDGSILAQLPMPPYLVNNFVKNSVEHGFLDRRATQLDINISGVIVSDEYLVVIEDNGCGINYAMNTPGSKGDGIALSKKIIKQYNKTNKEYNIRFSNDSITDKSDLLEGRGTRVVLKFIKGKRWI